jgi:hypothetical protein
VAFGPSVCVLTMITSSELIPGTVARRVFRCIRKDVGFKCQRSLGAPGRELFQLRARFAPNLKSRHALQRSREWRILIRPFASEASVHARITPDAPAL